MEIHFKIHLVCFWIVLNLLEFAVDSFEWPKMATCLKISFVGFWMVLSLLELAKDSFKWPQITTRS